MDPQVKNDRAAWLQGPSAFCSSATERESPWRLVLLGAPGVGKGTQALLLSQHLEACHLSTGDVFRAIGSRADCDQTPAMTSALRYMRRGELVPDSTVWEMVQERSGCLQCRGGFILDGFPRTLAQAESLTHFMQGQKLSLDAVVNYELPLGDIVQRLSGRRTCRQCKSVFHVTRRPPRAEGLCDQCGGSLCQREDDRPESIKVRMEAYQRSTMPLIDFYSGLGLLMPVDAAGSPEAICARTIGQLKQRR
jgi:adenylate kinase